MKVALDFKELLPTVEEADSVSQCFQCSACVADCPAARRSARFNPREIMLKVLLGLPETLVCENSEVWDCTTCYTCKERCPQGVHPIEVITALKNRIAAEGLLPEKVAAAVEGIKKTDRVIQKSDAISRRRSELGLDFDMDADGGRIEGVLDHG